MAVSRRTLFLPFVLVGAGWFWTFVPVYAQSPRPGKIRFTTLSTATEKGLKSDLVLDLTQDTRGNVWLATDRGLSRFDGWETIHYSRDPALTDSLSSDQLTAVTTSSGTSGSLWLGTASQGLIKFDQKSGKCISIQAGTAAGGDLLSDHIVALVISEDRFLWIGTDAGLNVLDLGTGKITLVDGPLIKAPIASITRIGKDEIWVGTVSGDLYEGNGQKRAFTKFWSTPVPVTAVARDSNNSLWIGTSGNGIFRHTAGDGPEPVSVPFLEKEVTSLFVDSSFNLWVGTRNGLALFDQGNDGFSYFTHQPRHLDSLTDNQVSAIYEDRARTLWIATRAGGTSRFNLDRQWFMHLRHQRENPLGLPHASVSTLTAIPGDGIWIGTERGLARWNPATDGFRNLATGGPEAKQNITALLKDTFGNLWTGTRGAGLLRRAPDGTVVTFTHDPKNPASLGHNNISSLFQDRQGRLFVATIGGGLWQIDPVAATFRRITGSGGDPVDFVQHLAEDEGGNLWVTAPTQIYLMPQGRPSLLTMGEVFPQADKPTSSHFTTLLPDSNGIVWIGTRESGLDRFNTKTGEITNYNSAINRLPDDMVASLIKDDHHFLWVATRTGVARLNSMQREFRLFGEDDGLQKDGFNLGAVARGEDGRLYFGGLDGLNIIDPARLPALPRTPKPILTSFDYLGETVVPRPGGVLDREIAATEEIRIPYDERLRFAFRFANLDSLTPNRGFFRYRLEGYEYEWQPAGGDRKAPYANLPPGKYVFNVQSSLDGENFPEVTAKVRVIITPLWWMTWWAKTLAVALTLSLIVGTMRLFIQSRVKQLNRDEEMLTAQRDKAEAALARQLQNRMLLDRTTGKFSGAMAADQILSDALPRISEQFGATHCLVQRLVAVEDENGLQQNTLKPIGYFSSLDRNSGDQKPTLPLTDSLSQWLLRSESVLSLAQLQSIPDSIKAAFPPDEPITLLAARTTFLEVPNGLILLLRVGTSVPWSDDDIKLLEALTGQFGLAIAQIKTAAIEEKYRHHLEDARHHAEVANRAKTDFLAKMTHELRTPLNAIIGFSEILGQDKTLNPAQRETLEIINQSGEHLHDVINEILDLSKIEAGKMELNEETFEFLPLLKSVYKMLSMKATANSIAFNFSAGSNLPLEITTDRSKLRQILINLIGNAIKFTTEGEVSISIVSHEVSPAEMVMGRLSRGIQLDFTISDTGRGIHPDEIGRLFERYAQTESGRRSSEGTGLGLPIAKSFIELMGGEVEVESIAGKGTTFRFNIKCTEVAAATPAMVTLETTLDEKSAQRINGFTSAHGEIRILIAEDQISNRLLLQRLLGKAGFVLAEAKNGQEAIDKWSQWKPHLILMDEDMPLKKGSEATREIKHLATPETDTVIVSLTAHALEQARLSAMEAGCADFVAKPFRSFELFSVISKHLGVDYTFNDAA